MPADTHSEPLPLANILAGPLADPLADADLVRASFETAPDGVLLVGHDGRILAFNWAYRQLWNFSDAMLARRDPLEWHAHTASQLQAPQAYLHSMDMLRRGPPPRLFHTLALLDGRVFEHHVMPMDTPGAAPALAMRWRDITERHRAVQQQQSLMALVDLAMMDADLVFWDADLRADRMQSANGHWHAMLGYRMDEVADNLDAWDALIHPDDATARILAWEAHLLGSTNTFETEFRIRHQQGHWVWMQVRGRVVERAPDGEPLRVAGLRMNISRRKETEARLEALAHTDALTGVLSRRRFTDLAADELSRALRHCTPLALLMIDLDHFKAVNDRLGHAGGDTVLRSFAATTEGVMRQGDVFGRVGGEEFAALLPQTSLDGALVLAQRLRQHIVAEPALVADQALAYTVSIGVAAWSAADGTDTSIDRLMVAADRALYAAKGQGRDRVVSAAALHTQPTPPTL